MILAPIILFTYKRLDTLKLTVEALQKNYLASKSDLIIFSDAAKGDKDSKAVKDVRDYLKSIEGFNSIKIYESKENKGLANSIIKGVSQVLETHDSVIVLEDDLVSSPNFLNFMNDSLNFYVDNPQILSIAGFSIPIKTNSVFDVYFTHRSSSWGWATWKNRWEIIDWEVTDYNSFKKNKTQRNDFNKMGSDMVSMLDRQMEGKINSWAIRWCYHQFKNKMYSVHPFESKIDNVGFSPEASNTKEKYNRYKTILDIGTKTHFNFSQDINLEKEVIKQFVKPFTITSRIKYKLLNLFSRF
jgi:hypothetical protein